MPEETGGGFDGVFTAGGATEVACWAHARRKFSGAQDSDPQRVAQILPLVGELYQVERKSVRHNNASERALKRVAIGRKNWLFAGNDAAAENHARLWSLIASCERHGVDPQRYLTSVLAKIGSTSAEDLGQFLPDVWKAEDAAEIIATS